MAAGDGLARVTYLPGVQLGPTQTRPDFATFFGEKPVLPLGAVPSLQSSRQHSKVQTEELTVPAGGTQPEPQGEDLGRNRREARADQVSLQALARKGLSRWELEGILLARDLCEAVVDKELQRLEDVGLVDDFALAETLVRTQHDRKGLGRSALKAELRRRHIPQEAIESALEQLNDDDEQARATELAIKRAGQLSSYDLETAKRRLNGFLMRRGYSSSVVRNAVDEALSGRPSSRGTEGVRFR